MKTHELAKHLSKLASTLRVLPNTDLDQFLANLELGRQPRVRSSASGENDSMVVNLATLAALGSVNKSRWIELIDEWKLPVKFTSKDSSRNIMGEVMRYLDANPSEIRRLQQRMGKGSKASPALMKALSILMSGNGNEEPQP